MKSRRNFLQSIAALCAAGGVAPAVAAQIEDRTLDTDDQDAVGTLVKCIHIYGEQATAEAIVASDGPVDARAIRRELNRSRQQLRRQRKARERRERHGGDQVMYRGPLAVFWPIGVDCREVRSGVSRHTVAVGTVDRDYAIDGIGVAAPERLQRVYVEPANAGRIDRHVDEVDQRAVTIPRGSRVVIDTRHGCRDVMAAEVIRTGRGEMRLHLWSGATSHESDDPPPQLRGGVVYETVARRDTGLLGLPLS